MVMREIEQTITLNEFDSSGKTNKKLNMQNGYYNNSIVLEIHDMKSQTSNYIEVKISSLKKCIEKMEL